MVAFVDGSILAGRRGIITAKLRASAIRVDLDGSGIAVTAKPEQLQLAEQLQLVEP
jgi:hypothetical protein